MMDVADAPDIAEKAVERRQFLIAYASSIGYFVVLVLLPAMLFFNVLVFYVLAYVAGVAVLSAIGIGTPLALLAQALVRRVPSRVVALAASFAVGALTAYVAFAVLALITRARFNPFAAMGSGSTVGVIMVIVIAGLCSLGGRLTATKNATPASYEDALEGMDFAELAELIRKSRDENPNS